MSQPRYFLPDHPVLNEVYSKLDLRAMLQSGELSRSDIVVDDETGFGHLLGDLLASPYRDVVSPPLQTTSGTRPPRPLKQEFRADTPLSQAPEPPIARPPRSRSTWSPPPPLAGDDEEEEDDEDSESELLLNGSGGDEEDDEDAGASPASGFPLNGVQSTPQQGLSARPSQIPSVINDDDVVEGEDMFLEPRSPAPAASAPQPEPAGPTLPSRGGEEILFTGHPSWFSYPKSLAISIACLCGAAFCFQQQFGLEWVVFLGSVAALVLVFVSLDRTTTTYYITTRRVEMEYGLVGRNSKEVRITDIRAIDVQQPGYAALVGIGNVDFDSSASPGAEVKFKDVRRPHDIKQLVRQLQG